MGRAPCCDKANVKKGPWSPEEDAKLKAFIEQHGTGGNWIALPQKIGLKRCGKSCRLRWLNYLRPNIKHGGFSEEEDDIICSLYISIGSRWSIIAAQLPGRTDNDIKNYWNTRLKKKLLGKRKEQQQQARRLSAMAETNPQAQRVTRESVSTFLSSSTNISTPYSLSSLPGTDSLSTITKPGSHMSINYIAQGDASFNDHASIRKLLIKLGGKFSDDIYQSPTIDAPTPNLSAALDERENPMSSFSSSTSIAHTCGTPDQLNYQPSVFSHYYADHATLNLSNSSLRYPIEMATENLYSKTEQQMDAWDYLYGSNIYMSGNNDSGSNGDDNNVRESNSTMWSDFGSCTSSYLFDEGYQGVLESKYQAST
ncbi:hypothetical protein AMTRI_Chr12g235250 [Amborella trichopoda]|uniref:Uncharacterized protein n=1 Tax=Amborella trichopoda TaxID=13333 RepID=U5DA20_AMBTC|nr:transcription factor RAX1 [Amborella trichopoda]ERN17238.1 hypothetical protein AMTR_s00044p00189590 [Amborella trichopoda]|eukprot:XP_006855771.1 transcription factor RAX1 [Amborella trichopoda]